MSLAVEAGFRGSPGAILDKELVNDGSIARCGGCGRRGRRGKGSRSGGVSHHVPVGSRSGLGQKAGRVVVVVVVVVGGSMAAVIQVHGGIGKKDIVELVGQFWAIDEGVVEKHGIEDILRCVCH